MVVHAYTLILTAEYYRLHEGLSLLETGSIGTGSSFQVGVLYLIPKGVRKLMPTGKRAN